MVRPRVEVAPVLEKSDSVETVDGEDNGRAGSFILNRNHLLWTNELRANRFYILAYY